MVRLVAFDDATEALVRFIEDTPRSEIVAQTLHRLRHGESSISLIRAAALAVSRSTELPPDHHGGPVHPVSGIHAINKLTERLAGASAELPVLQCVALANKHLHLPSMGPTAMVAFDDLKHDVDAPTVLARLEKALTDRQPRLAERAVTLACEKATPGQILNSLLSVALPRNSVDDHYLLYTIYCARALDAIGWEYGPALLRPVVRFLSRHASFDPFGEFDRESIEGGIHYYNRFDELGGLVDQYDLTEERIALETTGGETELIEQLAGEIASTSTISTLPETIAQGIARGLSLRGACEAMSVGGARLFLRSHTGNPFDVHIHTGISARRYLLGFEEIGFRTKLIALLGWAWGYEVRYLDHTLHWDWQSAPETLSDASGAEIIADIEQRIESIDGYDVTNLPAPINLLVAKEGVRGIVRLAESYAKAGHDPQPLFALSARLACREDASEMHGYKLQQAAYEEYFACREELRWVHLVSAIKQAAVTVPTKPHQVYPKILAANAA